MRCKTGEETWARANAIRAPGAVARRGLGADRPDRVGGRGAPPSGAGHGGSARHRLARFPLGCRGLAAVVQRLRERLAKARRRTGRSSCSPGWTIGCSPTSACAAPTSSSRSTAGWSIRGCGAKRRWRSYCSRAGAGRCRAPRPTAINRPRHDPFPTWPPDSHQTGWIPACEGSIGSVAAQVDQPVDEGDETPPPTMLPSVTDQVG